MEKAQTALDFRRPSKVFEDVVAYGGIGLRILSLLNALPIEGGVPIVFDGKVIGSIGVSGGTAPQDPRAGGSVLTKLLWRGLVPERREQHCKAP